MLISSCLVEVRLTDSGASRRSEVIRHELQQLIYQNQENIHIPGPIVGWEDHPLLGPAVYRVLVTESCQYNNAHSIVGLIQRSTAYSGSVISLNDANLQFHVYAMCN